MTTHVFHSETYQKRSGDCVLTDVNGEEVAFSFISETGDVSSYNYDDIVHLGEFKIVQIKDNRNNVVWQDMKPQKYEVGLVGNRHNYTFNLSGKNA